MALNSGSLATSIENNIRAAMGLGSTPYPQMTDYCNALAQAIVDHIKENAVVTVALNGTYNGTVTGATCSTTLSGNKTGTIT